MPRGVIKRLLECRAGLVVFLTAVILRLVVVFFFSNYERPMDLEYGAIARNLSAGYGYSFSYPAHYLGARPVDLVPGDPGYREALALRDADVQPTAFMAPLYTYLLSGLFAVFGGGAYLVLYLLQVFAGALAVLLLYKTAVVLFDERAALLTGLLAAILPTFVGSVGMVLPTALEQLVGCSLLYVGTRIIRDPAPWRYWIFTGLLLGLGGLLREVILAFGPVIVFTGLSVYRKLGNPGWLKRTVFRGGAAALIAVSLLTPWTLRNADVFDDFIPVTNRLGYNLFRGFNEDADGFDTSVIGPILERDLDDVWRERGEAAFDNALGSAALSFIGEYPGRSTFLVLKRLAFGLIGEFRSDAGGIGRLGLFRYVVYAVQLLLCATAFIGMWFVRERSTATRLLLYGFFIVYLSAILLTFVCTRFRVPLETVYCLLAGVGLNSLGRRLKKRRIEDVVRTES